MKIVNKTKKTTLAENAIEAKTVKAQSLGLLAHKEPVALILRTRFGIHTFGMKYPIDVLILDQTYHVAELKQNMQPNTIFLWNIKHTIVIELPAETIRNTNTNHGDTISF